MIHGLEFLGRIVVSSAILEFGSARIATVVGTVRALVVFTHCLVVVEPSRARAIVFDVVIFQLSMNVRQVPLMQMIILIMAMASGPLAAA